MVGYELLAQEQRDLTPEQVSQTPRPPRLPPISPPVSLHLHHLRVCAR